MGICRLCLQPESENIKSQKIMEILEIFIPGLYTILKNLDLYLCEICITNLETLTAFMDTVRGINKKIETVEKTNTNKIILKDLVKINICDGKTNTVCRLCLKIVSTPQIFLYENDTNVLRHDLIIEMLKFCAIPVELTRCERPVMCLQCWENLQICYSFKKDCLEIDKKIRAYRIVFCLNKKDITDNIFNEMVDYFSHNVDEELIKLSDIIEGEDEYFENNLDSNRYSLRKRLKKEYRIERAEFCEEKENLQTVRKRRRHFFTQDDDDFLLAAYLEIKNSENDANTTIWRQLQSKWLKTFPDKLLTISSIYARVKRILDKNDKTNMAVPKSTEKNKFPVKNNKVVNIFGVPSLDNLENNNSEQLVEDVPSSIKLEHEIDLAEFKQEPLSDCPPSDSDSDTESLPIPELERMDVPIVNDVCSVDVKKDLIGLVDGYGDFSHSVVEDYKMFKRITKKYKDHTDTTYKCIKCNFETKHQNAADSHSSCHSNGRGFECLECPFVTSKFFLLKQHLAIEHSDCKDVGDDDIPVLKPFAI